MKAIGSRIRSTGLFEDDEDEVETPKKPVDKSAIKRLRWVQEEFTDS